MRIFINDRKNKNKVIEMISKSCQLNKSHINVENTTSWLSLNKFCQLYIHLYFIYITFEAVILNVIRDSPNIVLIIVRYGLEGFGYGLLVILMALKCHKKFRLSRFDKYILCTIAAAILSSIINIVEFKIFLIGFRYLFRYLFIYGIIRLSMWNVADLNRFYKTLRIVMIIQIALVIFQLIDRNTADAILEPKFGEIIANVNSTMTQLSSKFAIYGSLGRYNLFGYFSTLAIWYWIAELESNKRYKIKSKIMLFIWVIMLIVSFSRQTIVGIFIAFFIYILMKKRVSYGQFFIIICSGLMAIILAVLAATSFAIASNYTQTGIGVVSGTIYDRYVSMFSFDFFKIDFEGRGRTWFVTEGIIRLLKFNPIVGYGVGMYGCPDTLILSNYVYERLNIPTTYYMDVYVGCIIGQIGLLGLIIYMLAYANMIKKCSLIIKKKFEFSESKKLSIITFGLIISTLVMMLFSSSLSNRIMALYVWIFIGFQNTIITEK